MKPILTFILFFFIVSYTITTEAQQINIRKYNIEDGLVNNDILNIYEDSRGFIWLCTRGGLSLYDGSRFTNFTTDNGLTADMINDIYEIAPQEFIIAQNSDGPRLMKNGQISPLVPASKITLNKFYIPGKGRLLATTDLNGVVEWNKNEFLPVNPAFSSASEMTVLNDSLWVLINIYGNIRLVNHSLQSSSPPYILSVTTCFTDSHHRVWIGTSHGLKLLDPVVKPGKPVTFIPVPQSFDLPILREAYISELMEDSRGNYWIGTSKGLVKIDNKGISHIYTRQDGLPPTMINSIKEDRQHNIWIGTPLGLAKFSPDSETSTFPTDMGMGILVLPLTENRYRLFDGTKISDLDLLSGKYTNTLWDISPGYMIYRVNKNELLVTNNGKGMIYYAGKEQTGKIDWPDKLFNYVIKTGDGHFLGAVTDKIFDVAHGNDIEKLAVGSRHEIRLLTTNKRDVIWAGTWSSGLLKISLTRKHDSLQLKVIDSIGEALPDQSIRVLYSDRENEIWVGTRYKGVVRVLELPGGKYEIQNYGTAEGLCSNFILSIKRDDAGNMWIGSMQGLDKLIPIQNRYRVFNFGKVNKVFLNVLDIQFRDKSLLLAGNSSVITIKDIKQDTLPAPPVYITKIARSPADSLSLMHSGSIHLPYQKAQIYFEFSAPQFINEEFTKYSYRLLGGNDTAWNLSGKSRSVYFASLRPGNYTFEVRALGFNDKWGPAVTYNFIVTTPFWQKSWFIVLVLIAIGLLVYTLYRYRIQQLIRLQKVRDRIATDLHDEIGSSLTNISILTTLSKRNISQEQKAQSFLQRITEEISGSSQALDDIIWSVNSSHDTLEETVARMRRYAAELFDAAGIRYELYLDPAFEKIKLSMEQRRDVYLLYKESVNNISKHADAKQVHIQIAIEHNRLLLSIKDDGKGFDANKESDRHGLKGMKDRVKKWKGSLSVHTAPKQGTNIQIQMLIKG